MSFCTKCGTEVSENAQFCSVCGTAKQGEQKGNALESNLKAVLGNNWNLGKTIISIALIVAFIAMFLPWLEVASSAAGGSITVNGWGSVNKTGLIIINEGTKEDIAILSTIVSIIGISTFLISLAFGIYAIKKKDLIKKIRLITYPCILPLFPVFLFAGMGMGVGNVEWMQSSLIGIFLFGLSIIAVIYGISFSNKSFQNVP